MVPFSLREIALILNATLFGKDCVIYDISIHSNFINKQCMFVALIGKRFDGHNFIIQAMNNGAKALLVTHYIPLNISQLIVYDTRVALIMLANWVRCQVSAKIIAITGSSGKTSVKEMTASILKNTGQVIATKDNLNNELGVAITLLRLTRHCNFAVIELGSSASGEIEKLSKMVVADTALVNNIYPSHLSSFKSLFSIKQEKGMIFNNLSIYGVGIVNADNHALFLWSDFLKDKIVWKFSMDKQINADFFSSSVVLKKEGVTFNLHTLYGTSKVFLPMLGYHSVANALAASALAISVGSTLSDIIIGLKNLTMLPGRLFPINLGPGQLLLDDSYNSNVGSMISSIDVLKNMPGYRVLVISDMAELGSYKTIKYHYDIGKLLIKTNIHQILTIGNVSCLLSKACGKGKHFYNKQILIIYLKKILSRYKSVSLLVKGSRCFKMEEIVEAIKG